MGYNNKVKSQKLKVKSIVLFVISLLVIFYLFFRAIKTSVILQNKEKVNVVFYGQNSFFYSFDRSNDTNYIIQLPSDFKSLVPGGYSFYRLGSLGKLVALEKKPDLFQKTFSAATSAIVDFYFYPKDASVYYNDKNEKDIFPDTGNIFFYRSNANWIDRIFLYALFLDRNLNHYKIINASDYSDSGKLSKKIQGTLYKRLYRKIGDNIQIIYQKSYQTAILISNIIDGEGIRVVDISQNDKTSGRCLLISKKEKLKEPIIKDLQIFFHCQTKAGETESSDIILRLGSLEKDWSVN